jgi:hypothetical protein
MLQSENEVREGEAGDHTISRLRVTLHSAACHGFIMPRPGNGPNLHTTRSPVFFSWFAVSFPQTRVKKEERESGERRDGRLKVWGYGGSIRDGGVVVTISEKKERTNRLHIN